MPIYLLHFKRPINAHCTGQHSCGSTEDVAQPLAEHAAGRGAGLTQVALVGGSPGDTRQVART